MLSVAVLLLCLLVMGCVSQRFMLYKPGFYSVDDVRKVAGEHGLRLWPVDGPQYLGLVGREAAKPAKGTVVVFHGNAAVAPYRAHYVEALGKLGYQVVLAEYPGYGGRAGGLAEKSLVADGVKVVRLAKEAFGGPLYIWGESLGAGVAAGVAHESELKPQGVVMMTPWDSLEPLARMMFPSFLVKLLLRDSYDSVKHLSDYNGSVAVIIAEHDEVIPNVRGRQLYDSLTGRKRLWELKGCGHNSWSSAIGPGFWNEVMSYVATPNPGSEAGHPSDAR